MPLDKNKIIRYQTLDRCFSDWKNKYFMDDLIRICTRALESAGLEHPTVSRSTIFNDIAEMTSNREWSAFLLDSSESKVGRRRYFRYAKPGFSIWKRNLNDTQLSQMQSVLLILRQFKDFPQADIIEDLIHQLESAYHFKIEDADGVIAFEGNENIEALSLIGTLFSHISHKNVLKIVYQPFNKEPQTYVIHPHFLKQYNRRWFLIGLTVSEKYGLNRSVFPLDRIKEIEQVPDEYIPSDDDIDDLFYDQIGVTIEKGKEPVKIKLQFTPKRFHYVLTKPIHQSQVVVKEEDNTITINVKPNKELYQTLLSFGSDLKIVEPKEIQDEMIKEIEKMQEIYNCPETLDK